MENARVRNSCLDWIKGAACFFVVFMHCEFPGKLGVLVQCVSRFCVPFFFMVSGYFAWYEKPKRPRYAAKLRHVGCITLFAVLFYLCVNCLRSGFSWIRLTDWSSVNWLKFLLFNEPNFVAGQLWFLFALFYVYVLWAITDRLKLYRFAYPMIPVLLSAYLLLAQGAYCLGFRIPNYLYRNFLIEGFPLFLLGHLIHHNQTKIHISNRVFLTVLIASTLLCMVERKLFGRDFGIQVCTFPQVISLFLLGCANPQFGKGSLLARFGLLYSMYIYILHPFVMVVVPALYRRLRLTDSVPAAYLQPILVLVGSVLLSAVVIWLKRILFPAPQKRQENPL